MESSDIDEARRVSKRERVNGANGKRFDIDAAKRRSQTKNWEVRVNQSKFKLTYFPHGVSDSKNAEETFPAGIEPTSKV